MAPPRRRDGLHRLRTAVATGHDGGPTASLAAPLPARWVLLAAAAVVAVLVFVFGLVVPNYDNFYAAIWGRDLAHGRLPEYFTKLSPAAHPGMNAFGAVVSLLGDRAAIVAFEALGFMSLAALAAGVFRLTETLAGRTAGAVAAVVLLSRPQTLAYGLPGFVDAPTAAVVVWAAVLEARAPRGAPYRVLGLLALAGLLRPESWLLAAGYAVWVAWPHVRARTLAPVLPVAALAALGPLLWLASDWVVTGDPLSRFHGLSPTIGAQELVARGTSDTGLAAAPRALVVALGSWMQPVPLALAVIGLGCAVLLRRWRLVLVPGAAAALGVIAFVVTAGATVAVQQRYLFPVVPMLCVFAGYGVATGMRLAARQPGRRRHAIAGAAAVLLLVAFAATDAGRIDRLRDQLRRDTSYLGQLKDLGRHGGPAVREAGTVYAGNPRALPALAFWSRRSPGSIMGNEYLPAQRPPVTVLVPADPAALRWLAFGGAGGAEVPPPALTAQPAAVRVVTRSRSWLLLSGR